MPNKEEYYSDSYKILKELIPPDDVYIRLHEFLMFLVEEDYIEGLEEVYCPTYNTIVEAHEGDREMLIGLANDYASELHNLKLKKRKSMEDKERS